MSFRTNLIVNMLQKREFLISNSIVERHKETDKQNLVSILKCVISHFDPVTSKHNNFHCKLRANFDIIGDSLLLKAFY